MAFAFLFVFGSEVAFVGGQGHFAVYNELFAFRQMNDEVGTLVTAILVFKAVLSAVMHLLFQSGFLQQHFQLIFAPIALGFVVAGQGFGEAVGVFAEAAVELLKLLDRGLEQMLIPRVCLEFFLDAFAKFPYFLAQGVEQGIHLFAIALHKAAALFLQQLVGQIFKSLLILPLQLQQLLLPAAHLLF